MTGFKSKRDMAEDKLLPQKDFGDALTITYQSGFYDGKKAAQPAQEPVGLVKDLFTNAAWDKLDMRGSTKVYLDAPPQRTWVDLTDEEVLQIRENLQVVTEISLLENLTKAIEAKLKEKNT